MMNSCSEGSVALADWCAGRSALTGMTGWSDCRRELVEGFVEPVAGEGAGGEFVVAAADVLDEGVTGGEDPRGPGALESAHGPEPGFEPPVIGLDRVVRVPLDCMQGRGDQLVPARSALVKNRRAAARSRRSDSSTSMTWPCWSIARYR